MATIIKTSYYREVRRMEKRDWLIQKRKEKGMFQRDVADYAGISVQFYSRMETGERRPSPSLAKKVAGILDFPWTKFYE